MICRSRLIVICWSQWAFWFGCFVCLAWQIDGRRLGWELPQVGWDVSTLQRLMRFLHGGPSFIRDPQDLDQDWINPFIGDGFCFVFLCVWWVWCASIVSLAFLGDFFPVTVSLCHAFLVLTSCTWLWAAFRSEEWRRHPKTSPESLHHQGETPPPDPFFFFPIRHFIVPISSGWMCWWPTATRGSWSTWITILHHGFGVT